MKHNPVAVPLPVMVDAATAAQRAREDAHLALRALVQIAGDPDAPASARVAAACRILDRGFGPAKQEQGGKPLFELSNEELAELLERSDGPTSIQ